MKTYCTKCGYANEYSGKKPVSCAKCGYSMGCKPNDRPLPRIVEDYDPEFSSSPTPNIEPFTEQELESIKIANAKQSFNLKDIMKGAAKKKPSKGKKKSVKKT